MSDKAITLQDKLNYAAHKRINEDISNFLNSITGSPFFQALEGEYIEVDRMRNGKPAEKDGKIIRDKKTLRQYFWSSNGEAFDLIKKEMIDDYIERETREFMEKVGEASNAISELENQIQE